MPKRNDKPGKPRSPHDDYELPGDVDFSKTRFIGNGLEALEKHAKANRRTVELEPDVAKEFATAGDVNEALRELLQLREALSGILAPRKQKRRKSA